MARPYKTLNPVACIMAGIAACFMGGCNSANAPRSSESHFTPSEQSAGSQAGQSELVGTPAPAGQSSGWKRVGVSNFSFYYPAGWQINQESNQITAYDPSDPHSNMFIYYVPIRLDTQQTGDLCNDEDRRLMLYYQSNFLPNERSDPGNFTGTTVTYDAVLPEKLGGREMWPSVVTGTGPYQPKYTWLTWLNIVPRADGYYVIGWGHAGGTFEEQRLPFANSLRINSPKLPDSIHCN